MGASLERSLLVAAATGPADVLVWMWSSPRALPGERLLYRQLYLAASPVAHALGYWQKRSTPG